ncbi:hypothetical protein [Roseomonas sp. BN140053]|uniref:hypothetical protein n=1 Tax=Roseomonas sp. BN140053 TaxID=3391898 RepID=UPI0039E7910E
MPSACPSQSPLRVRRVHYRRTAFTGAGQEDDADAAAGRYDDAPDGAQGDLLRDHADELCERIRDTPARTLAGFQAKARVVLREEHEGWESVITPGLLRDLLHSDPAYLQSLEALEADRARRNARALPFINAKIAAQRANETRIEAEAAAARDVEQNTPEWLEQQAELMRAGVARVLASAEQYEAKAAALRAARAGA